MTLKVSGANMLFVFNLLSEFYETLHSLGSQRDGDMFFFFW